MRLLFPGSFNDTDGKFYIVEGNMVELGDFIDVCSTQTGNGNMCKVLVDTPILKVYFNTPK